MHGIAPRSQKNYVAPCQIFSFEAIGTAQRQNITGCILCVPIDCYSIRVRNIYTSPYVRESLH